MMSHVMDRILITVGMGLVVATTHVGTIVATLVFGGILFSTVSLIAIMGLCLPFYIIWHWGGGFVGNRLAAIESPAVPLSPARKGPPHIDRHSGRWMR